MDFEQNQIGFSLCSWRFWSHGVKSLGGEAARGMGQKVFLAASPPILFTPHKQNRQLRRLNRIEFDCFRFCSIGSIIELTAK